MKALLAKTAHIDPPWRIHEIALGFDLYDVWALPTPGGAEDFPILMQMFLDADLTKNPSPIFRALFALRWRIGKWCGWDGPKAAIGSRVLSLRGRLPPDLKDNEVPNPGRLPFTSLYATDTEWAAEMANITCHAVMHIGWVPDGDVPGCYRGQMAVLVKPNGWVGRAYMAAIAPFRFLLVYPPLMRTIERGWLKNTAPSVHSEHFWSEVVSAQAPHLSGGWSTYADTLTMPCGSAATPRWWIHTMFEELIHAFSREVLFRGILALRPVRGPKSLMNWRVIEESDRVLRLERGGPLMSCVLSLECDSETVTLKLSVVPRHRLGAALWRKISPVHRKMGEMLLRRAWQRSEQARRQ